MGQSGTLDSHRIPEVGNTLHGLLPRVHLEALGLLSDLVRLCLLAQVSTCLHLVLARGYHPPDLVSLCHLMDLVLARS